MLVSGGILKEPLLYLSLYLKVRRDDYYNLLQRVRFEGIWEEWVSFFLDAVIETSSVAIETSERILQLFREDRGKITTSVRAKGSALQLHSLLERKPLLTIAMAANELKLTQPTIGSAMRELEALGIVKESSGRSWKRIYGYSQYLNILNEGMEGHS